MYKNLGTFKVLYVVDIFRITIVVVGNGTQEAAGYASIGKTFNNLVHNNKMKRGRIDVVVDVVC